MDAASVTVKTADGSVRVDAPMRSINRGSHSRVHNLYDRLGINLRRLDFGYTFTRLADAPTCPGASSTSATRSDAPPAYSPQADDVKPPPSSAPAPAPAPTQTTQLIYEGSSGLRWPPLALPSHLLPSLARPSPVPLLRHLALLALLALAYMQVLLLAFAYVSAGLTDVRPSKGLMARAARWAGWRPIGDEGLRAWCVRHGVWGGMVDEVLVPLWAAVATVDKRTAEAMPVGEVLEYISSTFGASHYVAGDGVRAIVHALAAPLPFAQTHTDTTLTSLAHAVTPSGRPRTVIRSSTNGVANNRLAFDHVVLATQANQARTLLGTVPSQSEVARARLDALGLFGYKRSLVVTHSDGGLLPRDARDVRDLVFASHARADASPPPVDYPLATAAPSSADHQPPGWIQATHVLSASPLLLQTTNPVSPPDPALVHCSAWFDRAVVSQASRTALPGFLLPDDGADVDAAERTGEGRWQGIDNIWLVGSWAAEGCPLLEGCVVSAERVVRAVARREGWTVIAE